MPIDKYFNGGGDKVMSSMQKQYGDKKGKSVFYATANKKGMNPPSGMNPQPGIKQERKRNPKKGNIKRG